MNSNQLRDSVKILVETAPLVIALISVISFIFQTAHLNSTNTSLFSLHFLVPITITVSVVIFSSVFSFAFSALLKKLKVFLLLLSAFLAIFGMLMGLFFISVLLPNYGLVLDLFFESIAILYMGLLLYRAGLSKWPTIIFVIELALSTTILAIFYYYLYI
ncbi:MAG: hypothetical protein QXL94_01885 [Candidatus Parvarchaeum sp.]